MNSIRTIPLSVSLTEVSGQDSSAAQSVQNVAVPANPTSESSSGAINGTVQQARAGEVNAGRQISEHLMAGNLLATQLQSQLRPAQNPPLSNLSPTSFGELGQAALQGADVMKLPPNVSAILQGDTLTLSGDLDNLTPFFLKAALEGKVLPSLSLEVPLMSGSGQFLGTQVVRLTNVMVSSFDTVDGGDRPSQRISLTFEKIDYPGIG